MDNNKIKIMEEMKPLFYPLNKPYNLVFYGGSKYPPYTPDFDKGNTDFLFRPMDGLTRIETELWPDIMPEYNPFQIITVEITRPGIRPNAIGADFDELYKFTGYAGNLMDGKPAENGFVEVGEWIVWEMEFISKLPRKLFLLNKTSWAWHNSPDQIRPYESSPGWWALHHAVNNLANWWDYMRISKLYNLEPMTIISEYLTYRP